MLGPSTAMLRPPAPASLVQMENSASGRRRAGEPHGGNNADVENPSTAPTWYSSFCSLQARASRSDLVGPALSQGADSELEGTARHVSALVLYTDGVHAGLGGNEADAVGVVLPLHDVGFVGLA